MRDLAAALGLVFAIESLLAAGLADAMRRRVAAAARDDPMKLHDVGLGAAVLEARSSGPPARPCNRCA
ncbi:MAG: DUF2065 family protein [Hyphomicrobiales bacterium]|nr:DUF2065 family protein [Hyphomicrobiales bacterium]